MSFSKGRVVLEGAEKDIRQESPGSSPLRRKAGLETVSQTNTRAATHEEDCNNVEYGNDVTCALTGLTSKSIVELSE